MFSGGIKNNGFEEQMLIISSIKFSERKRWNLWLYLFYVIMISSLGTTLEENKSQFEGGVLLGEDFSMMTKVSTVFHLYVFVTYSSPMLSFYNSLEN